VSTGPSNKKFVSSDRCFTFSSEQRHWGGSQDYLNVIMEIDNDKIAAGEGVCDNRAQTEVAHSNSLFTDDELYELCHEICN